MSSMFIVVIGSQTNDARYFGPYGGEDIAQRACDELAAQGHEGAVRPLTNGLRAYRDVQDAVRSSIDDVWNDWTHPNDIVPAGRPSDQAAEIDGIKSWHFAKRKGATPGMWVGTLYDEHTGMEYDAAGDAEHCYVSDDNGHRHLGRNLAEAVAEARRANRASTT